MKKTFNINIGNSIVPIEEDAYEMLTIYLNEVKQHFAKNADDFEIVTDIENRVAEMFSEMLASQQKQVVNLADVQSVMQQMGSVKDFETSEEATDDYVQTAPQFSAIKKLYRDTDQAVIAGVCKGLGYYLNIDARWIRLVLFLTIFMAGAGVIAYIVLWIMVPRAQTRAEKMEMRGEETNLRGFANSYLQPFTEQSRGFIAEFFHVLGSFIEGAGKVIFKFIAAVIVIFGSFFLLVLIIMLAAFLGFGDSDISHYFPFNIVNEEYLSTLTLAAFVILSIPVLALILFSIRVAFNKTRPVNKTLSFGLLIIWIAGVMTGIFYVAKISSEFKEGAEFAQVTILKPQAVYTLDIERTRFFTKQDSLNYRMDAYNYKGRRILNNLNDDFEMPRSIRLRIEKSLDGKSSLSQNYRARGRNFEIALKNAQGIHYDFSHQNSSISFNPMMYIPKMANWRAQEVELTLNIPVGVEVRISEEVNNYLSGYGYWDCDHKRTNGYMEWVMTDGGLKCKYEKEEPKEQE